MHLRFYSHFTQLTLCHLTILPLCLGLLCYSLC